MTSKLTFRDRHTGVLATLTSVAIAAGAITIAPPAIAENLQPLNIRLASDLVGPPHPAGITMEYMKETLPKIIPGSKMRIYYAGSLYNIPEAVEAMSQGNVEMTWGQFGKSAQIEPYMSVVNGPMLLTTPGAMNQFEKFETYRFLKKRMSKTHGVELIGAAHLSMYMGYGGRERILDDFKGKKIRSMGPAENAALKSWNANPTTMAFGDVPPALETKVIDGLLTSLGGFNVVKNQAPYFTVAGINGVVGDYYWIGASQKWLNRLNKTTRTTFQNWMTKEIIPLQKKLNWCNDKRVLDLYGTKDPSKPGIYILPAAQQASLQKKLGSATAEWIKSKTPGDADQWVDKFAAEARTAVKAHPIGSDALEATDCAKMAHWFTRYKKFVKKKKKKKS